MSDRPALREALGTPERKRVYVRRLFSTIADRYDLITVVLSYGQDRRWKRRLAAMSAASAQTRALDLACGTGDIAFALHERGAFTIGLDITPRMIEIARGKALTDGPRFLVGDMMALPFSDASFDIVTTGYGIRNVPVIAPALDEIHRVLRPGGMLLSLDFNRPANPVVRAIYVAYLTVVGSTLGLLLHGDPDTYRYIPESIRRYPGAAAVCRIARESGFAACEHVDVLGGLMAIHRAVK
ncbi:MAG TPA: ubiquinone/menaquinone biosynthesis methyltransferase [Vicinamibacterales bacterium]|nr:ubiquinone/menaquinone biosynthesis methyltransferase [Vicinamibacterales bacterium]